MFDYTLRTDKDVHTLSKQPTLPRKGDRIDVEDELYVVENVTHEVRPIGTKLCVSAHLVSTVAR